MGAEFRGLVWNITIDDVADAFDEQKGKCALTGWDIAFPEFGQLGKCSIDRIDSSKGYEKYNIQLVDGRVNMMKGKYENEFFIQACKAVSENCK